MTEARVNVFLHRLCARRSALCKLAFRILAFCWRGWLGRRAFHELALGVPAALGRKGRTGGDDHEGGDCEGDFTKHAFSFSRWMMHQ